MLKKKVISQGEECREIFGEGAKSASQKCYKEINYLGNHSTQVGFISWRGREIVAGEHSQV